MIFDCTERYDPVTKQWAAVASLNFPRCGVGVCPCHGALYALGKCQSNTSTIITKIHTAQTVVLKTHSTGVTHEDGFTNHS